MLLVKNTSKQTNKEKESNIYLLTWLKEQSPVVERVENAIQLKNDYPADKCQQQNILPGPGCLKFGLRYPLDKTLSDR